VTGRRPRPPRPHQCGKPRVNRALSLARPAPIRAKGRKNLLRSGRFVRISALPNFARACGRVPVGGHPEKSPDSRQGFQGRCREGGNLQAAVQVVGRSRRHLVPTRQPAAGGETGEPRTPRGTQLKATTNGLFWSRRPSKGRHRRGLFLIAPRAEWSPLSNPRQHRRVKALHARRVSIARRREVAFPR
jgi:hypothetical protein